MPVDFGALDPKQEAEAAKLVKHKLSVARKALSDLESMRRLLNAPAIKAKLGSISKEIYDHDPTEQIDALSVLPNELKCHVWSYLDNSADRLMFALTCKWNAATFEMLKDGPQLAQPSSKTTKSRSKRKADTSFEEQVVKKKARTVTVSKAGKADLIPVLHRLQDWMDNKYRLCYACFRFRSRHSKSGDKGRWTSGTPFQPKHRKLTKRDVDNMEAHGPQCPECNERATMNTQTRKENHKELKKITSDHVGLRC